MDTLDSFWAAVPFSVRLFVLILLLVATISIARSARLVSRLYRYRGKCISRENIVEGAVDADLLATYALANRLRLVEIAEKPLNSGPPRDTESREKALYALLLAESRFLYLWERSYANVMATRRACSLVLLLSFLMLAYGAYPTYYACYNNSKFTGSYCFMVTGERLLGALSLGLSICTILYLISSFCERALADRMASWKYVSTMMKVKLER